MGRIIMGTVTLAIAAYLAYRSIGGSREDGIGTPKQRLDNVRGAADRIEKNDQKAADEALKKADDQ
jgi:hypothetical protein